MQNYKNALKELFDSYQVAFAYLFGSQAQEGMKYLCEKKWAIEKFSDLDIGVKFLNSVADKIQVYGQLYAKLSIIFKPFNVDLLFMEDLNALIQYEIINGLLIYSQDNDYQDRYEEKILKQAEDLQFNSKQFYSDFHGAIQDGYFQVKDREDI